MFKAHNILEEGTVSPVSALANIKESLYSCLLAYFNHVGPVELLRDLREARVELVR